MADEVRKRSSLVEQMACEWPLIAALRGGTRAMRAAGKTFMPQWPAEDKDAYEARLAVATLFPAFNRTVEILAAKPFSKPLTYGDDVPARIKGWCDDIDLQGRSLHVFGAEMCDEAVSAGFGGILVDYPPAEGVRTLADEAAAGVRPYFVHIKHEQILGWKAKVEAGVWKLLQLRFLEMVEEDDGEFGTKMVEQVRVLAPGSWQIWRKVGNTSDWALFAEGVTTLKAIPFVPVYGRRKAFMIGMPPMLDLAYMNVEHWQSKSDQQNILHVSRVPILAALNCADDFKFVIGANTAVKINGGEKADLKYVEHTGAAIGAGRQSLLDLEDQMRQAGAELLVIKPGNVTESQTLADNEQGKCALQRIAEDLEDSLDQALQYMADWVNEPSGGNVTLFKEFGTATLAEASAELLQKMTTAGQLSKQTQFEELQRRGIISEDRKWDDEQGRISEEPPSLGVIGSGDGE